MIHELLSKNLFIPIGKTFSGRRYYKAKKYKNTLERDEYTDYHTLRDKQFHSIRKMINHAFNNVPYYKSLFKQNRLHPEDIKYEEDLKKIPCLTKDILIRNLVGMKAENINVKCLKMVSTGGTTGKPISFWRDKRSEYLVDGSNWRFYNYCKYTLGDRIATLWGNEHDLNKSKDYYGRLKSIMENRLVLNFYDLSDKSIDEYVKKYKFKNPSIIRGFSSAVYKFVRHLKTQNIDIPLPRSVIITADKITDYQRKELDDFFGNCVFNEYGCREFSILGFECLEHQGIHIDMANVFVEIDNNESSNDHGEILVTSLINWGMPFIRYRIEDASKWMIGQCLCGRTLPRVESIQGRISDFVVSHTEKLIHGEFFSHLLYEINGIENFQAVQKEIGKVDLYLERNEYYNDLILKVIDDRIRTYLSNDMVINTIVVDKITKHPSGKRRPVISEISKKYI